ncbi:SURF1 family cytochrome oxidase biogenesis protein, partial [Teichococcus deserti]|uniref:SURF1 family cytochrome oxidase biogenesis protein n=1 Tax=Teichococcus deserti TaxID=1817963 RepID=UPI00241878E0
MTMTEPAAAGPRPSSPVRLALLLALALAGILALLALGTWQVERRAWKLALIDRIESRVTAVSYTTSTLPENVSQE